MIHLTKVFSLLACFSLAFALTFPANGQQASAPAQSKEVKDASIKNKDRLVMDFNIAQWQEKIPGFKPKFFGRGFNFYLMYNIQLGKSKFSIAPGGGLSMHDVYFDALFMEDSTGVSIVSDAYDDSYKKSKFSTAYLEIPIELRFIANPKDLARSFKAAIGFRAGVRIDAKTKVKREINGEPKVFKNKRWNDAQVFRYGPSARIGYGPINVVAFYSLSDVFKKDRGPELTPWSIGISLNGL